MQSVEDSDDVKRLQQLSDLTCTYVNQYKDTYSARLKQIILQSNSESQLPYLPFYIECSTMRPASIYFKSILRRGNYSHSWVLQ